jgi:hypothetical protein
MGTSFYIILYRAFFAMVVLPLLLIAIMWLTGHITVGSRYPDIMCHGSYICFDCAVINVELN